MLSRLLKLLPRSLHAETLTALLETLSALFKYVLIPSDTMDHVWTHFVEVLPKCNPEVQRVVSELWGNALRRMKSAARESCVVTILNNASADVGAWIFVTACKVGTVRFANVLDAHICTPVRFADIAHHYPLDLSAGSAVAFVVRRY